MSPDSMKVLVYAILLGIMSIFALGAEAFFDTHVNTYRGSPELWR